MMDPFALPIGAFWLAAGVFLLLLEAFAAPGIGLAFGGLAALVTGALVQGEVLDLTNLMLQFALWFGLTLLLALLLWKPLKTWRSHKPGAEEVRNVIGDTAVIEGGDLLRGQVGQARWSGTIMLAEIDPIADAVRIEDGESAEIVHVRGNTLYLRPKGSRRQEEVI